MSESSSISVEERVRRGQSEASGDTGDGQTGVSPDTQGISNRRGDHGGDNGSHIDDDVSTVNGGANEGLTGDAPADEEVAGSEDDEKDDEDDEDDEDDDDDDE
jgi:hypothetical protein